MNLAGLLMLAHRQPAPPPPPHPVVVTAVFTPAVEPAPIPGHGDAVVYPDDLAPASCDTGTGYWAVMSVRNARIIVDLNPGLVCEFGVERYGPVEP